MASLNLDAILLPENLQFSTYKQLVQLLSENDVWKVVAEYFEIFSDLDIQRFTKNAQPAEKFLLELGTRLCTIEIFCDALEKCQLFNVLMLFKTYSPVKIVEQTVFPECSNTQMVIRGQSFTLCARAVGIPPPKYQWYHDNVELVGENSCILNRQNFDLECEGEYYCIIVQEGYGSVVSNSANLVLAPESPVVVKQPIAKEVCSIGSILILTVRARGHPDLQYQWYKGNQQLNGCTSSSLTMEVKTEAQAGRYRCYIHNSAGEVWTNESVVTVYVAEHPEPSAKVALLISNQLYENLTPLYTPENDVKTLSDLLRDLGFLVIALQNLKLSEMRNAIRKFANLLPPQAYVVFYFAGHGFEIQDKFMLPVDSPDPDDYLQTDAISERELLREVLSTNPMLFLELLDMCLKPPISSNKKIFQEPTDLYEYEANNNLIQGYSTTSCLGAYEKKTGKNGLYVEHLKRRLIEDKELPIVEILQKLARDVASVCVKQKPFFGTNVTVDYRLTDHCNPSPTLVTSFKDLMVTPEDFTLKFERVGIESRVTFSPYLNVYLNTLEIRITNLTGYRVTCEDSTLTGELRLIREGDVIVINMLNLERLTCDKNLTLRLMENDTQVDWAVLDIGRPLIALADLWRDR